MPSFFKDLKWRSRANSKNDRSDDSASSSGHSGPSASDTNGSRNGSRTPSRQNASPSIASSLFSHTYEQNGLQTPRSKSSSNLANLMSSDDLKSLRNETPPIPTRPQMPAVNSQNRYSIVGSVSSSPRAPSYSSPLSPRVTSVSDGSWVHQKVLLISGTIGDTPQHLDGQLVVCHHQDTFPSTTWPISESHFKALVHLQPGPNRLRLDFLPIRKPSQGASIAHSTWIHVNYLPLVSSPPLHLVILLAKDSPMTFDSPPDRIAAEGNGLDTAIKKFRMAAHLWQAFTGEQMNRNGFGRRCFRFEEEWQPGTLSDRDGESAQMRNEAKVHIIRTEQSLAEIRDLDIAQQNQKSSKNGDLFGIAMAAVKKHFGDRDGQKQYVSCMFLDSHWDGQTIRGHAALGGGAGNTQLAIFGSHALWSYPTHIEEVVPAFSDCTRTDTKYVANDCNESGSTWEAANIGIGAHMHETGHLFGCPHQETGVMLRDYVRLNRTFMCREPYSTRSNSAGMKLCQQADECGWHRLDVLRFRFHPCFRLPSDQNFVGDDSIQVWAVDNGNALVTAPSGLAWIEIYVTDELCRHWIEYVESSASGPRQITLTEQDLRTRVGDVGKGKKLRIKIFSCGQGEHEIQDFAEFVSKSGRIKLADGRSGFKGSKVGWSQMDNTQPHQVVLESSLVSTKLLTSVRIYSGFAFDGMEFSYENGERQLFGKRGGDGIGQEFALDTRRGETIVGFYLRAGAWVDGIQILTSSGRRSEVFGNRNGGSGVTLIPPRGYTVVGIYGTCGAWVDGFGLVISR